MGITVREVLQFEPFKRVRLLAGAKGLDRSISSVNIIEVPSVMQWMHGGELLFSAGFSFHGDPAKGCQLLRDLSKGQIAALALKPGQYMQEIPQAMVDLADALCLPLLELPQDMPYSTCMEEVYRHLLNERLARLEDLSQFYAELLHTALTSGTEGLLPVLNRQLGTPVYAIQAETMTAMGGTSFPEDPSSLLASLTENPTSDSQRQFAAAPIFVQGERRGWLAARVENREDFSYTQTVLRYAANIYALEFLKDQEVLLHKQKLQGELLADLLEGHCTDSEITHRRGKLLNYDLKQPYVLMAFQLSATGKFGDFLCQESAFLSALRNSIRQYAAETHGGVLFTQSSNGYCGMLSLPEGTSLEEVKKTMVEHCGALRQNYPAVFPVIGISRIESGIEHVPAAYQEAEETAHILRCLRRTPPVAVIDDLGIYRILVELSASPAMRNFYKATLQPLLDYDQNGNTSLLDTLDCYFTNGCSLRATADALFLHKNSVSYRLRKIEELLGRSLSDPETVLNLQVCLKYRALL